MMRETQEECGMEQVPVHLWQVILSWMADWTTKAKIEAAIAGHPIMDEVEIELSDREQRIVGIAYMKGMHPC